MIINTEPIKFDVKIDDEPSSPIASSPESSTKQPIRVQKYSRNYLMSLREAKMSLQLPNLPNIPELHIGFISQNTSCKTRLFKKYLTVCIPHQQNSSGR